MSLTMQSLEEIMRRQKAKIQIGQNAKEGGANSWFSLQIVKGRRGRSLINKLETEGGCFAEDENGIEKVILDFFKNLYQQAWDSRVKLVSNF